MRGIDTARRIIEDCKFAPMEGKAKVYVLNEVHKATNEFQNAMLDVLEAPPKHVYFILCTTEPEKVLKTIKGQRATIFQVSTLRKPEIMALLKRVFISEFSKDDPMPENLFKKITEIAEGSPRKALDLLDQVIDIEDDSEASEALTSTAVAEATLRDICQLLMKSSKNKWSEMVQIIKGIDAEPEQTRRGILTYLSKVLMSKPSNRLSDIICCFEDNFYDSGKAGLINALFIACMI
jgi:DNA polymerase-3 subunit gamma/tau